MGKYLDIVRRVVAKRNAYDQNDIDDKRKDFGRLGRLCRSSSPYEPGMVVLERRCPDHVEPDNWLQAVEDGRRFLGAWGEKAAVLGWTARDLFGLAPIPDKPHPSYRRLSRYDETGLIWLLRGRQVLALTEITAAVESPTGAVSVYRRHNKPALGPLGDSLDDLACSGFDHCR
jgi:hypothetical protein